MSSDLGLGAVLCACSLSTGWAGIGISVGFGGEPAQVTWQVLAQGGCLFQKQKANSS